MTRGQIVALCGSPRPASHTIAVATGLAQRLSRAGSGNAAGVRTVDLLPYGPRLFDRGDAVVRELVAAVCVADLLVVASPVFRGSYTGLLKAFLDQLPRGGLARVRAVPVMVGGLARHADVAERMLAPLLAELEAQVLPSLFVREAELDHLEDVLDEWMGRLVVPEDVCV